MSFHVTWASFLTTWWLGSKDGCPERWSGQLHHLVRPGCGSFTVSLILRSISEKQVTNIPVIQGERNQSLPLLNLLNIWIWISWSLKFYLFFLLNVSFGFFKLFYHNTFWVSHTIFLTSKNILFIICVKWHCISQNYEAVVLKICIWDPWGSLRSFGDGSAMLKLHFNKSKPLFLYFTLIP